MYLTYEEYQSMGGSLDATAFCRLEFEAEATIDWYTFNRLKNDTDIPYAVKQVINHLITLNANKDALLNPAISGDSSNTSGGIVKSQSNDGVSVTYETLNAKELIDNIKAESERVINMYLQGVTNEAGRRLLYRGLYPGE